LFKHALVFAIVTAAAVAAVEGQFPSMTPSLEFKPRAILTGATNAVTLDAVRATQRLVTKRSGIRFRNGGRMAIPQTISAAPDGLKSISMALPLTDVPDGGIYIVRLSQDKEGLAFDSEPERSNRPGDDSIVFRPAELQVNKHEDGLTDFILPRPLEPGKYAIAIANNQYAWGFVVQ
jgi:hypothetical protein